MVFKGGDIPVEIRPSEGVQRFHQKLRDDVAQMFERSLKEGTLSSKDDLIGWEVVIKPILRMLTRYADVILAKHQFKGEYHGNLWETFSIDKNSGAVILPTNFQKTKENDATYHILRRLQKKDCEDLYEMLNVIMHPQGSDFKYQALAEDWLSNGREALLTPRSWVIMNFWFSHPYLATGKQRIKLMVGLNAFCAEKHKKSELDKIEPAFEKHFGTAVEWKKHVVPNSAIAKVLEYVPPAEEAKLSCYDSPSDPVRVWQDVYEHKTVYVPEHLWSSEAALANRISAGLPGVEVKAIETTRTLLTEGYLDKDERKDLLGKLGWCDSDQPLPEWMEKELDTVNEEARLPRSRETMTEQSQWSRAQTARDRVGDVQRSHQKLRDDVAQMFERSLKEGRVSSKDDSVGWEVVIKPILRKLTRYAAATLTNHQFNGQYHGNLWESISIDENNEAVILPTIFRKPKENDDLPALQKKDCEDLSDMLNEIMHPQGSDFKYQGPIEEWLSYGRDGILKSESSRRFLTYIWSKHPYLATGKERIKLMVGLNAFCAEKKHKHKKSELDKIEPAFEKHFGTDVEWKKHVVPNSAIAKVLTYEPPAEEAKLSCYDSPSDPVRVWQDVYEHKTIYVPEHEWSSEAALANWISAGLPDVEVKAFETTRTLLTEGYLEKDERKNLLGKVGWWDSDQPLLEWMEKALDTVNEEARLRQARETMTEQSQWLRAKTARDRGKFKPIGDVLRSHQKLRDDVVQMFERSLKEGRLSSKDDSVGWEETIKPLLRELTREVAMILNYHHSDGEYHGNLCEWTSIDKKNKVVISPPAFQQPKENEDLLSQQEKDREDLYEMVKEIMHPEGSDFKYQGPLEKWLWHGWDAIFKWESCSKCIIEMYIWSEHPYLGTGEERINLMLGLNTFRGEKYSMKELDKLEPAFKENFGSAEEWKEHVVPNSAIAEALGYKHPATKAKPCNYNRPSSLVRIWRNAHRHKNKGYVPVHEWSSEAAIANRISEGLPGMEQKSFETTRTLLTVGFLDSNERKNLLGKVGWWDSDQALPEWMEKALNTVNEEARQLRILETMTEESQRRRAQTARGRGRGRGQGGGHDFPRANKRKRVWNE